MFSAAIQSLPPAYFAMVMATGMVAVSASLGGLARLAEVLTWLNLVAFGVLCLLTLARVAFFPRRVFADLIDHNHGVGFFTLVAGVCVLGNQLIVVFQSYRAAAALWLLAIALWFCLTYTIFTSLTVKEEKPLLPAGIHGGWLVAVVATQAVSNLAGLLWPTFPGHKELVLFFSLGMWLAGGMLYIWMISIIFYRYTFFRFSRRFAAAVLDQHGSHGDLHAGWNDADRQRPALAISRRTPTVPQWLHRLFLGHGDLVDSHAHQPRYLAARL